MSLYSIHWGCASFCPHFVRNNRIRHPSFGQKIIITQLFGPEILKTIWKECFYLNRLFLEYGIIKLKFLEEIIEFTTFCLRLYAENAFFGPAVL